MSQKQFKNRPSFKIREGQITDLDGILSIEEKSFLPHVRSSKRSLEKSLQSQFQEVWVLEVSSEKGDFIVGTMILHVHQKSIRIYSLAIDPKFRTFGFGKEFISFVFFEGVERGFERILLEANLGNQSLITWYSKLGFKIDSVLEDYYQKGEHALKMICDLSQMREKSIKNLVVLKDLSSLELDIPGIQCVTSEDYIINKDFQSLKNARVINLSESYDYQGIGYYISLLASARGHRAIPNTTTIRDFNNISVMRSITFDIEEMIQSTFSKHTEKEITFTILFGSTSGAEFQKIATKLFQFFEIPFLKVTFIKGEKWFLKEALPISFSSLDDNEKENIPSLIEQYFLKKRHSRTRLKNYKYDLAILVNPQEAHPPSCKFALREFKKAASKVGFSVEFITKDDFHRLAEFDALFIRETTNVNNHTYHFSRMAYAEGLVVLDDPWSILRCSNKVYLKELMAQNMIQMPKSEILLKGHLKKSDAKKFTYPIVLKDPDGAFSIGVTKVNNEDELWVKVNELFENSDLIIAQEFLPSDFDWRIGILDQNPLFASKYYMAKGHWQIYNWNAKTKKKDGDSSTVSLGEVPPQVLKVAKKAASLIGDGLYGVDLKVVGDKVYLIEVNDNPNIDVGIEDEVLREELYLKVMQSFYNRIEMARNISRFVSIEK